MGEFSTRDIMHFPFYCHHLSNSTLIEVVQPSKFNNLYHRNGKLLSKKNLSHLVINSNWLPLSFFTRLPQNELS